MRDCRSGMTASDGLLPSTTTLSQTPHLPSMPPSTQSGHVPDITNNPIRKSGVSVEAETAAIPTESILLPSRCRSPMFPVG